jgi:hypothetical protein
MDLFGVPDLDQAIVASDEVNTGAKLNGWVHVPVAAGVQRRWCVVLVGGLGPFSLIGLRASAWVP